MTKGVLIPHEPLHVLVVEDQPDVRQKLVELIRASGCNVNEAADGAEALKHVGARMPDVVLMDLGMPTMDGWNTIRRLRRGNPEEPYIVVVSAHANAEARRAAFDAGCNEYIVKPFDVVGALRAYVTRRGHRLPLE